ncbi:ABC transporter ATP-binding protein [Lacticaseibacillus camelliae]|uniref:Multidrug ABC transporter ATPase permease n=1 Tax=Lacticaseibacillus camelliae DSM 22697 = JCM 13995 TaxID=1423730 RepID=A0A0R2EZZ0_9LACO|nr:ABC transporter ATP-binding protein [Lacticaseibacillus camelliae]KRN20763.1 multidrug ABC transporter ATPase permease [Lacticaseibacillus camelliae DSM 22697 = JCM 13995]
MFKILMQNMHGKVRLTFFLAPLVMLIEVFCDLQQPTMMADIVDSGLAKGDMQFVIKTAALMLMFALIGICAGGGSGVLGNYASLHMGQSLRTKMLTIALNSRAAGGLPPATLITRITNDVTQMQNLVMMMTRGMVRAPMLMLGGVVMSTLVSPRLAPILFVILPILLVYTLVVMRRSLPFYTDMQGKTDDMNRVMRENLQGAKTIKAFVLENHQQAQFTETNNALLDSSVRASMATVPLAPVIQFLLNLGVVIALAYGGTLDVGGVILDGQIIAFINYMIQITNAMVMTVNIITAFSRAITSATRVQAVLSEQVGEVQVGSAADAPQDSSVTFDHVSFGYDQSKPILDDISFSVPSGQWLGIIGTTGSGKSTLINLLTRGFDDYTGTIRIGGVDTQQLDLAAVHHKVTVATQDAMLFSGTVRHNLTFGEKAATEAELAAGAHLADADEFIEPLPKRYDAPVEQGGKNFSGGQRQRLNIARAAVPDPDILVFDDATSAVDQTTNARIQQRLVEHRRGRTTLIISQRVANLLQCDQILVMQEGRLAARGTHQELLASSPFYAQLVETQLGGGRFDASDESRA